MNDAPATAQRLPPVTTKLRTLNVKEPFLEEPGITAAHALKPLPADHAGSRTSFTQTKTSLLQGNCF